MRFIMDALWRLFGGQCWHQIEWSYHTFQDVWDDEYQRGSCVKCGKILQRKIGKGETVAGRVRREMRQRTRVK